jgi:hypothetical protein
MQSSWRDGMRVTIPPPTHLISPPCATLSSISTSNEGKAIHFCYMCTMIRLARAHRWYADGRRPAADPHALESKQDSVRAGPVPAAQPLPAVQPLSSVIPGVDKIEISQADPKRSTAAQDLLDLMSDPYPPPRAIGASAAPTFGQPAPSFGFGTAPQPTSFGFNPAPVAAPSGFDAFSQPAAFQAFGPASGFGGPAPQPTGFGAAGAWTAPPPLPLPPGAFPTSAPAAALHTQAPTLPQGNKFSAFDALGEMTQSNPFGNGTAPTGYRQPPSVTMPQVSCRCFSSHRVPYVLRCDAVDAGPASDVLRSATRY